MFDFAPNGFVAGTAFGKKNVDVRIPLKAAPKGMKNANEAGSEVFGFVQLLKHKKNTIGNSSEKAVQKVAIFAKENAELFGDSKNTMTVRGANKFKRHSGGAFDGIKIAARRTKTAFASKGNELKLTAMFATVKSKAVFRITAMKHFVYVFKDGIPNGNTAIGNRIKMIIENLL